MNGKQLQQLYFLLAVSVVLSSNLRVEAAGNNPRNIVNPNAPSSKGNEFVLAFWSNGGEANIPRPTIALFVTTDDPDPVSFTVDAPNINIFSQVTDTANAGQTTVITLPTNNASPTVQSQDIRVFQQTQRNKGIRVKAEGDKKISVYGLNDDDVSTDAFLALPCVDYGENAPDRYTYYIFSADVVDTTETFSSRFMIVPCEDDTEVNLIPSHTLEIAADISSTGFAAQVGPGIGITNFRISLDSLETAMFQSPDDLTGTILESNKPITVLVGHECGQVPEDVSACDVLVEQVPPHIAYGTVFLTAPLQFRESGERYRIGSVSNSPNEVTVTCTSEGGTPQTRLTQTLARGQYAEFDTSGNTEVGPTESYRREFCCIETSLPATVMQYTKGHSFDEVFDRGDPAMLYVPPVTQYLNDFTLTTAKQVRTSFEGYVSYTIASQFFTDPLVDGRKLLVNGDVFNPESGYSPIYCSDFSTVCGYGAYSALPQGDHAIIYDQPGAGFYPFIYGLDIEISFEYPSGFELEPEGLPVIEIPDRTVPENIGTIEFPIRRVGGDLGLPSFIVVSSRDTGTGIGDATAGSDYEAIQPTNANFQGHRLRYQVNSVDPRSADTLSITILDDDDRESTETFEVYLVEVRRNAFVSKPIGTVTILDDDSPPEVGFDPVTYDVEERQGFVDLTIRTNNDVRLRNGGVLFFTDDGSAVSSGDDVDFTATSQANAIPVTFPDDDDPFTTVIRVPINDDDIIENTENFFGRLVVDPDITVAGLVITAPDATVNIIDQDIVTLGFDPTSYSVLETDGSATLDVKIFSGRTSMNIVVDFTTQIGSAVSPGDFTATSQTLTFGPGVTTQSVNVPIIDDDIVEELEFFNGRLSLGDPTQSSFVTITEPEATVEITSDDAPEVGFDPVTYDVEERQGFVDLTIRTNDDVNLRNGSVLFFTDDGSAMSSGDDVDFTATSQANAIPVTFPDDDDPFTTVIRVPINDDDIVENTENFFGRLVVDPDINVEGLVITEPVATVNIIDQDIVTLGFDPTSYSVLETDGSATLDVKIFSGRTSMNIFVDFTTQSGSAVSPGDFTATSQTLTFGPGVTTQSVNVPIIDDDIVEQLELFNGRLSFGDPTQSSFVTITEPEATVEIISDDVPEVGFDPVTYDVEERQGFVDLTIRTTSDVSLRNGGVLFFTDDGSAVSSGDDVDFTATSQANAIPVTFPDDDDPFTTVIRVPINDDDIVENTENFFGRLVVDPNVNVEGLVITEPDATVNIIDQDIVTLGFDPTSYSVLETDGSATLDVKIFSGRTSMNILVDFTTQSGSAVSPGDFTATTQTLTFGPGVTTQSVNVPIIDDDIVEELEIFNGRLSFGDPTQSSFVTITEPEATVEIISDDVDSVTVGFDPASYSVDEGGIAMLRVVLSEPSMSDVTVDLVTVDQSAVAPGDYTTVTNTVTFPAGTTEQTVSVQTINDSIAEAVETFGASISNPSPNAIIGVDVATVEINDNDNVIVEFDPTSYVVNENEGFATVTVVKLTEAVIPVSVGFRTESDTATSTDPADFSEVVMTLTFEPDEDALTIEIPIINDMFYELSEVFNAALDNPGERVIIGAADMADITILDDDTLRVEFDPATYEVNEDAGVVNVMVVKVGISEVPITVELSTRDGAAVAPGDYTSISRTLTFQPDESSLSIPIDIINDDIYEFDELFNAVLTNPGPNDRVTLGVDEAAITILDNDDALVEFDPSSYSVDEDDGSVDLIVVSRVPAERPITVDINTQDGSASAPGDYISVSMQLVFQPGMTQISVPVTIVDDEVLEPLEDFTALLSNPGDRVGIEVDTATISINDNDELSVSFEFPTYDVPESQDTIEVCVESNVGNSEEFTVDIVSSQSTADNFATDGEDFTGSRQTVTFPVSNSGQRQCVEIDIMDDPVVEGDEPFSVEFELPPGVQPGPNPTATVTIIDDDDVEVEFERPSYVVDEGSPTVEVCFNSSTGTKEPFDVMIAAVEKPASSNPATLSDDFLPIAPGQETYTFAPSEDGQRFCAMISIVDDNVALEGDEEFSVIFTNLPGNGVGVGSISEACVTITDNDDVSVSFKDPEIRVTEDDTTVEVCVVSSNPVKGSFVVETATEDNSATAPDDYMAATASLTFEGDDQEECYQVTILEDEKQEGEEDFNNVFTNVPDGVSTGTPETSRVIIVDDEQLSVSFEFPTYDVPESQDTIEVCVESNVGNSEEFTVDIVSSQSTADNFATDGEDFTGSRQTVTFPVSNSGQRQCVEIDIMDDPVVEGDEPFSVEFELPPGVQPGPNPTATVTIIDDDDVEVEFERPSYVVDEGSPTVEVCFNSSTGTKEPFDVMIAAVEKPASSNPATLSDDFLPIASGQEAYTFAPSEDGQRFCAMISIVDDNVALEGDEEFSVIFTNLPGNGVGVGSISEACVTITDNDDVSVSFRDPEIRVTEDDTTVEVCVVSSNPVKGSFVVETATEDNSATAPDDYMTATTSLTFEGTDQEECYPVTILEDEKQEGEEDFNNVFTNVPDGVSTGTPETSRVIIVDDEQLSVSFEFPTYDVPESQDTIEVCVESNVGNSEEFTVDIVSSQSTADNFATDGEDFTGSRQTVTFPVSNSGQRQCVEIDIMDDPVVEGDEPFSVEFELPPGVQPGPNPTATVTIIDDDDVEVEFERPSYVVDEGSPTVEVCFNSSTGTKEPFDVMIAAVEKPASSNPATLSDDFLPIASGQETYTFAPSEDGQRFCAMISIVDDNVALEGDEEFSVIFTNLPGNGVGVGSISEACVTITDNDVPVIEWETPDVSDPEGGPDPELCYTISTALNEPVTFTIVSGDKAGASNPATAGSDYSPISQEVTIGPTTEPGRACITVLIIDDEIANEGDEQYSVGFDLSGSPLVAGASAEACVTIIDDDVLVVEWETPTIETDEDDGSTEACFTPDRNSARPVTISIGIAPKSANPATRNQDYSISPETPQFVIDENTVAGERLCVPITIINDEIALEGEEQFRLFFAGLPNEDADVGPIDQVCVSITDDDVLGVEFNSTDVVVNEDNGTVTVCLKTNTTAAREVSIEIITVEETVPNAATDSEDFKPLVANIVFQPGQTVSCGEVPIIDDPDEEPPEVFMVSFGAMDPNIPVRPGEVAVSEVTIIDNDVGRNETVCRIDTMRVKPFSLDNMYRFQGPCEHILLSNCDLTGEDDFVGASADFHLDSGEPRSAGFFILGAAWISFEDGEAYSNVDGVQQPDDENGATVFSFPDFDVITRQSPGVNRVEVGGEYQVVLIHQYVNDSFFELQVGSNSIFNETCGLCGNQTGELLQYDRTVANIGDMAQVEAFAQSYLVPPNLAFSQRVECGTIKNDTIIGDPLYTVPFAPSFANPEETGNLCYEVRGRANTTFNLVSDTCVSVNAYYSPMNNPAEGNIMSQIAVRAVGESFTQCYNIHVDLDGCSASMNSSSSDLEEFVPIGERFSSDGISVRSYSDRVRISVPNCENVQLVMWVICERRNNQDSIKFVIARGINLRQTSHGLIGQFWNVEIEYEENVADLPEFIKNPEAYRIVTVPSVSSPGESRRFLAQLYHRTWDKTFEDCHYAGDAQGGPSGEIPDPDDSVIEGKYVDYIAGGLFETEYGFNRFDEERCL